MQTLGSNPRRALRWLLLPVLLLGGEGEAASAPAPASTPPVPPSAAGSAARPVPARGFLPARLPLSPEEELRLLRGVLATLVGTYDVSAGELDPLRLAQALLVADGVPAQLQERVPLADGRVLPAFVRAELTAGDQAPSLLLLVPLPTAGDTGGPPSSRAARLVVRGEEYVGPGLAGSLGLAGLAIAELKRLRKADQDPSVGVLLLLVAGTAAQATELLQGAPPGWVPAGAACSCEDLGVPWSPPARGRHRTASVPPASPTWLFCPGNPDRPVRLGELQAAWQRLHVRLTRSVPASADPPLREGQPPRPSR